MKKDRTHLHPSRSRPDKQKLPSPPIGRDGSVSAPPVEKLVISDEIELGDIQTNLYYSEYYRRNSKNEVRLQPPRYVIRGQNSIWMNEHNDAVARAFSTHLFDEMKKISEADRNKIDCHDLDGQDLDRQESDRLFAGERSLIDQIDEDCTGEKSVEYKGTSRTTTPIGDITFFDAEAFNSILNIKTNIGPEYKGEESSKNMNSKESSSMPNMSAYAKSMGKEYKGAEAINRELISVKELGKSISRLSSISTDSNGSITSKLSAAAKLSNGTARPSSLSKLSSASKPCGVAKPSSIANSVSALKPSSIANNLSKPCGVSKLGGYTPGTRTVDPACISNETIGHNGPAKAPFVPCTKADGHRATDQLPPSGAELTGTSFNATNKLLRSPRSPHLLKMKDGSLGIKDDLPRMKNDSLRMKNSTKPGVDREKHISGQEKHKMKTNHDDRVGGVYVYGRSDHTGALGANILEMSLVDDLEGVSLRGYKGSSNLGEDRMSILEENYTNILEEGHLDDCKNAHLDDSKDIHLNDCKNTHPENCNLNISEDSHSESSEIRGLVAEHTNAFLKEAVELYNYLFGEEEIFFEDTASCIQHVCCAISKDQEGSRLVQKRLEESTAVEVTWFFSQVLERAPELSTNLFGNYVIQKLISCITTDELVLLVEQLSGQIYTLSTHPYGCRVIQKVVDYSPSIETILDEMRGSMLSLIEDQNGNHVVQKCIEKCQDRELVLEQFERNPVFLSTHRYGCRVIQRLLEFCTKSEVKRILDLLVQNIERLVNDQYGNYVIQHLLGVGGQSDKDAVIERITADCYELSKYKFSSNVIEQCVIISSQRQRDSFMRKFLEPEGDRPRLFHMCIDMYGNYVVQRFYDVSSEAARMEILRVLKPYLGDLKKVSFARHILSKITA